MRHPAPRQAKYSGKGTFFPSAIAFSKILPFKGTVTLPGVVTMRNMLCGINRESLNRRAFHDRSQGAFCFSVD